MLSLLRDVNPTISLCFKKSVLVSRVPFKNVFKVSFIREKHKIPAGINLEAAVVARAGSLMWKLLVCPNESVHCQVIQHVAPE